MRNWLILLVLGVMGLVYAVTARWSHFEKTPDTAADISMPQLQRSIPTLERRSVNSSIRVLQQSHVIFAESWRLLVGTSSIPNSVMKATAGRLSHHLAGELSTLQSPKSCPQAHDDLLFVFGHSNSENIEINLKHNTCRSHLSRSGSTMSQPVAELKWSRFENSNNETTLEVVFHPNQISEGAGESLAMLNNPISCLYQLGENDKILKLNCHNLGQGVGRAEHYSFSKFEYVANQQELLIVEADHYQNLMEKIGCASEKPCLNLRVPLLGKIHVVDNRKMGKIKKLELAPASLVTPNSEVIANSEILSASNAIPGAMANSGNIDPGQAPGKMRAEASMSVENGDPALQGLPSENIDSTSLAAAQTGSEIPPRMNPSDAVPLPGPVNSGLRVSTEER